MNACKSSCHDKLRLNLLKRVKQLIKLDLTLYLDLHIVHLTFIKDYIYMCVCIYIYIYIYIYMCVCVCIYIIYIYIYIKM